MISFALGIAFLICGLYLGLRLVDRYLHLQGVRLFFFGCLVGVFASVWGTYFLSLGAYTMGSNRPFTWGTHLSFAFIILATALWQYRVPFDFRSKLRDRPFNWFLAVLVLAIASTLMWSTFSYDVADHNFQIGRFVFSDFASHIPLIRSFSMGENIPTEAPLMAGERLRYHFHFWFYVATLERMGLPIDWALNIPSTLGFGGLLAAIVFFGRALLGGEGGKKADLLLILLFLTSSSLAFLSLGLSQEWNLNSFYEFTWGRTEFLNGGPYFNWNQVITGLFWTLSIFTNQRQFAFGIALPLFILTQIYFDIERGNNGKRFLPRGWIFLAILMGGMPFLHGLSFVSFMLVLGFVMVFKASHREDLYLFLFVVSAIAIPQMLYLSPSSAQSEPGLYLGYGLHQKVTIQSFFIYWSKNLSTKFWLLPLFAFLMKGTARVVFLSSLILFVLPNLMKFGPDVWTNHKFFNIWLVFLHVPLALLLVKLFCGSHWKKPIGALVLLLSTLSGLFDLPPIYNDTKAELSDWHGSSTGRFIAQKLEPREPIVTSYRTYHIASLTGRPILLGWPYFLWSAGHDDRKRMMEIRKIYESRDNIRRCQELLRHQSRYVIIEQPPLQTEPYKVLKTQLLEELKTVHQGDHYIVLDADEACRQP